MMRLEIWILFGHLLSVMVWLGGGVMLYVLAGRARTGGDPAITDFARLLSYAGPRVLRPATLGTVVFGVWLVLQRAVERGTDGAAARQARLGQWISGYRIILLALLVATWDMAFKPGL